MFNPFIFKEGIWLGEGLIALSHTTEALPFYTKWNVTPVSQQVYRALQIVEIKGVEEPVVNDFLFDQVSPQQFLLSLESEAIGKTHGKGSIDLQHIRWEFQQPHCAGFEVYTRNAEGGYSFTAEYGLGEYKTCVQGTLWQKKEL